MPQPRRPGGLTPSRNAAFRRAHRAADRYANGRGASPARHHLQRPPNERGRYQSSQASSMTLRELERWIAWEIVGHYHQRIHAVLHRPPIAVWCEHDEQRNFRLPVDRLQFWISFLPEDE